MISQFKLSELGEDLGLNAKLFGVGSLNEILLQDQAPLPPPVAGESQLSRRGRCSHLVVLRGQFRNVGFRWHVQDFFFHDVEHAYDEWDE